MRQSGFLAAACLYALEHHVERLAEDHLNAERLAKGLADLEEVEVTARATNMVFARIPADHCTLLEAYLAEHGVLAEVEPEARFVTHLDVAPEDIDAFVGVVKRYFASCG